jgi:hypothetical protein
MVAIALFSLAIYAWAQHVALPRDAVERLIASVPDESPIPSADEASRPAPSRRHRGRPGLPRIAR